MSEISGFSTLTTNRRTSLVNKTTQRDLDNILTAMEQAAMSVPEFVQLKDQLINHIATYHEDPHGTTELYKTYSAIIDLLYIEYQRLNKEPISKVLFEEVFTTKQDISIDIEDVDDTDRQDTPISVKVLKYLVSLHDVKEDIHPNIFDTFEYTTVPTSPVINILPKMYLGLVPLNSPYLEYVTYSSNSVPISSNTIYISGHMYNSTDSEKSILKFMNDENTFSIEFTQKPSTLHTLTAYIKNGSTSYTFDIPFDDDDFAFFVVYTPTYIRILRRSGTTLVQQNLFTVATFYTNMIYLGLPVSNRFEYEEIALFDNIAVYPSVLDADTMNLILDTRLT